jgi:dTDP-4-dehydrorhamnose 3,5-epimerase
MRIEPLAIDGLLLIEPRVHADDSRGAFAETFRARSVRSRRRPCPFRAGEPVALAAAGTVRGLHCQRAPRGQAKLVRVARGAVLDVAVDARPGSPTFGRHVAVELSADNWRQLYVPDGFLHGYCTLVDDVELLYKASDYYSPADERAVFWGDPDLAIDWPVAVGEATVSAKDLVAGSFRDFAASP